MRLIDADALGVGRCRKDVLPAAYCAGWNGLINLIEQAPTIDAVPVVRCNDCKRYGNISRYTGKKFDFNFCDKFGNVTKENDLCSYGERKEGAGE